MQKEMQKRERNCLPMKKMEERGRLSSIFFMGRQKEMQKEMQHKSKRQIERERERERDPKHRSSVQLNVLCRYSHQGQRDRVVKVMD